MKEGQIDPPPHPPQKKLPSKSSALLWLIPPVQRNVTWKMCLAVPYFPYDSFSSALQESINTKSKFNVQKKSFLTADDQKDM